MKRIFASALLCLLFSATACAEIYKCKTADGRTIFSDSGCGTEVGAVEPVEIIMNTGAVFADGHDMSKYEERVGSARRPARAGTPEGAAGETLTERAIRLSIEGVQRKGSQ